MKIAFLFKRDSHFKAVKSTALRVCVQYNCEPVFIGIESDYSPSNESYSITYIDKYDLSCLSEYDYVIACLGGYLLNQVVSALKDTDTKVISIFPGIVSHYQLDAFISRLNADQVWLNSKADFKLYSKLCKLMRVKNNSVLYGMPWINLNLMSKNNLKSENKSRNIIFFEQTELFSSNQEELYFYKKLSLIFSKNRNLFFKYKVRNNTNNMYFKNLRKDIDKNGNVEVTDELTDIDILNADFYVSISSSAIVEGLLYQKYNFLIIKELIDRDSLEFFKKSNLFLKGNILLYENFVDETWLKLRVKAPEEYIDLNTIEKKLPNRFVKKSWIAYYLLLAFSLFKLECIKLIFNDEKKNSIVKSIDYLNS